MRSSIRAKLLAAFAIDLLLMISLGWFASQQMQVMNARAAFVEQQTIPSLDAVAKITTVINRYRVQQLEYLIYSNKADKDRSAQKMHELEGEMAGYFARYQPLVNSPDEQGRFSQVVGAWEAVVEANQNHFIPATSLANTGSVQPFYSRMNPFYNELDQAMAQLSASSQSQATDALEDVRSTYLSARAFIMADTILTLVISAAIGLVLSGRIALRIRRLTSATSTVAAGDLDRKVEIVSRDELGTLAQTFNQMVDSLREQRGALEQRNHELHISLRRQEQLMADLVRGKQAEEEAQRAQAAAEAASQAKSMFLATMSHELRTPLNAILGYAQLLHMGSASRNDPPEMLAQLERILGAGRHLTTLISNVLDFSKIEQGKIDISLSPIDPCALASEAADLVDPLMRRQHNTLRMICQPDIGPIVSDGPKLRQVLFNLLSNAAKFTESGSVTLRVSRASPAAIVFEVSDTGIGIAPDQLRKLFQPFSQVDASVTRRFEGTGLGLALSRQLCLALGGDITVESAPGVGSTFRVHLPDAAPAERPALLAFNIGAEAAD
jgi:signal transduction histidine kinase